VDTDASEGADPQCSRLPGRAMGGVLHTATLATEESSRAVHDGGTGHDEPGGGQLARSRRYVDTARQQSLCRGSSVRGLT